MYYYLYNFFMSLILIPISKFADSDLFEKHFFFPNNAKSQFTNGYKLYSEKKVEFKSFQGQMRTLPLRKMLTVHRG